MIKEMKLSIIICTCNRAESLKRTLNSITTMSVPQDLSWELIIVDNNSSDTTKEVVEEFKINSGLNVVYAFEEKQGLSNARNCGIKEAKGNIIAFTDDDCIVDKNWLFYILKEFDSDVSLAVIGGRTELYDQNDYPVSIRTFREKIPFLSSGQLFSLIIGSNMAFNRRVFDALGGFDPDFGIGTRVKSADDSDFLYRAHKMGFKMVYCPDILVYHNHGRKTDEQVRTLNKGYVIGRGAFYCKHILRGDQEILKMALYEVVSVAKKFVKNLICLKSIDRQMIFFWVLLLGFTYRLFTEFRNLRAG